MGALACVCRAIKVLLECPFVKVMEMQVKGSAYSFRNVAELRLSDVQLSEIKLGLTLFRSASGVIVTSNRTFPTKSSAVGGSMH